MAAGATLQKKRSAAAPPGGKGARSASPAIGAIRARPDLEAARREAKAAFEFMDQAWYNWLNPDPKRQGHESVMGDLALQAEKQYEEAKAKVSVLEGKAPEQKPQSKWAGKPIGAKRKP